MSLHPFFSRCREQTASSSDQGEVIHQTGLEFDTDVEDVVMIIDDVLPKALERSKQGPKRQMRLSCMAADQGAGLDSSIILGAIPPSSDGPEPEENGSKHRKRRRTTRKPKSIYAIEAATPDQLADFLDPKAKGSKPGSRLNSDSSLGNLKQPKERKNRTSIINYKLIPDQGQLSVGATIANILSGELVYRPPTTVPGSNSAPPASNKSAHPFFSVGKKKARGQSKVVPPPAVPNPPSKSVPSLPRQSSITPIRRSTLRPPSFIPNIPAIKNRDGEIFKHPGMRDAPFPNQYQVHVRPTHINSSNPGFDTHRIQTRRQVGRAETVPADENLLLKWAMRPDIDQIRPSQLRSKAHELLRVPKRKLISGEEVQHAIFQSLVHKHNFFSLKSVRPTCAYLRTLFHSLKESLSAYDRETCEGQSWPKKYAPTTSAAVLQPEGEIKVLRSWLQSMVIRSVDSSMPSSRNSKKIGKDVEKAKKKKRRVDDELDDFIVSGDDEDGSLMDDLSDPEIDSLRWGETLRQRSCIHRIPRSRRKKQPQPTRNSILISGSSGCGKTAAVYAVAKELGFEVFEINSGSRRSGKDILDRIGSMVENHLVQRVSKTLKNGQREADTDETLAGATKQASNMSISGFFNSTATRKNQPQESEELPPSQKQSLILLEEVDVLFEEDKQFWETVRSLALHSKRPIVMTCSDENLVPLETLDLHAILRFRPAPVDLAVDYLTIISALEGHILDRSAITSLYTEKGHDLRATMTELNFWCQMGVGDRLGGLEWLFQRWPVGSDIDSLGRKQRVISENTYRAGMGLIAYDLTKSMDDGIQHATEAVLFDVWDHWAPDLHNLCTCLSKHGVGDGFPSRDQGKTLSCLELAQAAELESDVDLFSRWGISGTRNQQLDNSVDKFPESLKANHPVGTYYLHANPVVHHSSLTTEITVYSSFARRTTAPLPLDEYSQFPSWSLQPSTLPDLLVNHQRASSHISGNSFPGTLDPLDFGVLDCLAEPPVFNNGSGTYTISSFDREFSIITLDIAPFVRSIVRFEQARRQVTSASFLASVSLPVYNGSFGPLDGALIPHPLSQRNGLEGGIRTPPPDHPLASVGITLPAGVNPDHPLAHIPSVSNLPKPRATRSSRSAMEGVPRHALRRENWLPRELSFQGVLATAGPSWGEYTFPPSG